MISKFLVEVIEKNADKIAGEWLKAVRSHINTRYYRQIHEDVLLERGRAMYGNLRRWLNDEMSKEEILKSYKKYGAERYEDGIPLAELVFSLILFRRHLWLFVLHSGFYDTAYELLRALELNNRVILFFDRVTHSILAGYEECLRKESP